MSLLVIKAGLLDTIQDLGRTGYRHEGINPSGAMDTFAARLANALIGKELHDPVIEMHFPAPHFLFKQSTVICLCGANFLPVLDNVYLPLCHPVIVPKGSILRFENMIKGARCYLALLQGWRLNAWMGSYSTNMKAGMGGWKGRSLLTGDELPYLSEIRLPVHLQRPEPIILPWTAGIQMKDKKEISFIPGNEWSWLKKKARQTFLSHEFSITQEADRMGYQLSGTPLQVNAAGSLVSTAVGFGTIQLLPNGQLVILMADHQTTGGYPRIGHIISADLPLLAQKRTFEKICFSVTQIDAAQKEQAEMEKNLRLLQYACKIKMETLLHEKLRS